LAHKCKLKRAAWQKIDLAANKILIKESKGAKDQRYAFQGSENRKPGGDRHTKNGACQFLQIFIANNHNIP